MWNVLEKVAIATVTTLINTMNTSSERTQSQSTASSSSQYNNGSSYHSSANFSQSSSGPQAYHHTEYRSGSSSNGCKAYQKNETTTCSCRPDKKKMDKKLSTTEKPKGKLGDNVCLIRLPKHAANASEINITIKQGKEQIRHTSGSATQNFHRPHTGKNHTKGSQRNELAGISAQNIGKKSTGKNNTKGPQKNNPFKGQNNQRTNVTTELSQSTWMYVGRLQLGTNKPRLINFLRGMFPGYNFQVEPLPLYRDAVLPCFKVLVNNRILSEFKQSSNWPVGATVKKFDPNFKHN